MHDSKLEFVISHLKWKKLAPKLCPPNNQCILTGKSIGIIWNVGQEYRIIISKNDKFQNYYNNNCFLLYIYTFTHWSKTFLILICGFDCNFYKIKVDWQKTPLKFVLDAK